MNSRIHSRWLSVVTLCGLLVPTRAALWHVGPTGSDSASGAAWSTAKRSVTAALNAAVAGDEVWVAAGAYPEHIQMKDGVALYGGFAGSEFRLEERDWITHRSVLDGTTNGVVLTLRGCGPATRIDGFTMQNGSGHGIACLESAGLIRNNLVRGNLGSDAAAYGGGILVSGGPNEGELIIEANRITDNANFDGGGIACIDASPRIQGNVISWNLAYQNGGGISCWRNSSPTIAHNLITGNTASWILAMPVPIGGGGISATADDLDGRPHPTAVSAPRILNNVIAANGAWRGGGVALFDSNGGVPAVVNNTIVANNGAGVFWGSSSQPLVATRPIIRNNIVAYNPWGLEMAEGTPANPNIEFNCIYGNQIQGASADYQGLPSQDGVKGNFSSEPGMVDFAFGNLHLQPDSPCVDAGTNTADVTVDLDIDGQRRVQGARIDVGADESDGLVTPVIRTVVYVRTDGDDAGDGRSWRNAKRSVQAAIDLAKVLGAEVWVAQGTYAEHIVLPAFVYVYGGFAGTEETRSLRSVVDHPAVLDGGGKIKVVQCGNGGYLVSRLDGFTIQNGGKYTGGVGLSQYGTGGLGGGLYLGVSSPYIANNLIRHNSLAQDNSPAFPQPASYGAGIYCELSYALITGNTLRENEVLNTFDGSGGGIYCTQSQPVIERNELVQNHARYGAAIYGVSSSPVIRNNLVQSNAMYNTYPLPLYLGSPAGAITLLQGAHVLMEGNTLSGNSAAAGAGIYLSGFGAGRIQNNLLLHNRAEEPMGSGGMGGGIYCLVMTNAVDLLVIANNTFVGNVGSTPLGEQGGALAFTLTPPADKLVIANNVIVSNSSGIFQTPTTPMSRPTLLNNYLFNSRSNYVNLAPSATDQSSPVLFADPVHSDYRLQARSPGIDAGSLTFAPETDWEGKPRPLDGDGDGGAQPDAGAFEFMLAGADSDHDSMPDGWEWENGLNPVRDDASLDRDGDGMSNRDERTAGTNPQAASSVLRLAIRPPDREGEFRLSWPSVSGHVYTVEFKNPQALEGLWYPVGDSLPGTGAVLELRLPAQNLSGRLYRIEVRTD